MKKIKGAIFDLDGTLLSSTDVWSKIDVEFLGKRGLEVPEDYVETITPMEFKQIAGGGDGRMEYYGKRCL